MGIADPKLTLEHTGARVSVPPYQSNSVTQQFIVVLRPNIGLTIPLTRRWRHLDGELRAPECDHPLELGVRHCDSLECHGGTGRRLEKRSSIALQLFGSDGVEHDPAVRLGGRRECEACRKISPNQVGDWG